MQLVQPPNLSGFWQWHYATERYVATTPRLVGLHHLAENDGRLAQLRRGLDVQVGEPSTLLWGAKSSGHESVRGRAAASVHDCEGLPDLWLAGNPFALLRRSEYSVYDWVNDAVAGRTVYFTSTGRELLRLTSLTRSPRGVLIADVQRQRV